jgi:hypothetical protein
LPGVFVSLLPVGAEPSLNRITDGYSTDFQRPDGELVGKLRAPLSFINIDANGAWVSDRVWTGGTIDTPTSSCQDWRNDGVEEVQVGFVGFWGSRAYNAGLYRPCTVCSSDPLASGGQM